MDRDDDEDLEFEAKSKTQNSKSEKLSQTQPELKSLLTDIFGDSDDDDDEVNENVNSKPHPSNSNASSFENEITDSDEESKTRNNSSLPVIKSKKLEDDIFGSEDEEDVDDASAQTPKRSRLQKGIKSKLQLKKDAKNDVSENVDVGVKKGSNKKDSALIKKSKNQVGKSSKPKVSVSRPAAKTVSEDISDGDESDAYDSGEEVVKTAEDDAFIDKEDDNADIVAEYEEDEQHFDDERPQGDRSRSHNSAAANDADQDPLSATLRGMKRKRTDELSEMHKSEIAQDLLYKMDRAAKDDQELYLRKQPAVNKLNLLSKVQRLAGIKDLQLSLLDFDLLGALRVWIEPKDKKTLPSLSVRTAIYEMLRKLPIQLDHLKRSGIGKVLVSISKHEMETPANKLIIRELIDKWSRPIFGKSADVRCSDERRTVATDESSKNDSLPNGRTSNGGAGPSKSLATLSLADLMGGGPAVKDPFLRVQCPRSQGFVFRNLPESKAVDKAAERPKAGTVEQLRKVLKDKKGAHLKQNYRAMTADLTGRNIHLN